MSPADAFVFAFVAAAVLGVYLWLRQRRAAREQEERLAASLRTALDGGALVEPEEASEIERRCA